MTATSLSHEGPVSLLTITRPEVLNALSPEVLAELEVRVDEVRARGETRGLVLTGAGKAFVAGADIAAMRAFGPSAAEAFARRGHAVLDALSNLPVIVIAAVNGFALGGGCELAMACDVIFASEKAKLGQPEVKLGVVPGFGGTQRLVRRVGLPRALELVATGRTVDATEALRIGLVDAVHAPERLLDAARELVQTIATTSSSAVAEAKRVMYRGAYLPLPEANRLEIDAFARCFATRDQKEGMAAFVEKRAATFAGRDID